jgi:hypothetical protein
MLDGGKLSGKEAHEEHKHMQNEKDTMAVQTKNNAYEDFMVYFRLYMSVHIKSFENEVVSYGKS